MPGSVGSTCYDVCPMSSSSFCRCSSGSSVFKSNSSKMASGWLPRAANDRPRCPPCRAPVVRHADAHMLLTWHRLPGRAPWHAFARILFRESAGVRACFAHVPVHREAPRRPPPGRRLAVPPGRPRLRRPSGAVGRRARRSRGAAPPASRGGAAHGVVPAPPHALLTPRHLAP